MLDLVFACLAGVLVSVIVILFSKLIRSNFPIKVTCWFCEKTASVPFGNRNCWDCPSCDQYNGFTSDGDYNKPIPAQWTTELNHPVSCERQEFIQSCNGLCAACNERQLLKMQQLAVFKPFVESNYRKEVNDYKEHLEKIYRLCYKCNLHVHQELERQDLALKLRHSQYLSNDSFFSSQSSSSNPQSYFFDEADPIKYGVKQWCSHLTGFLSCMLAVCLLIVHLGQIRTKFASKLQLPTWVLDILKWLTDKNCGIAFSGLFLCLTSKFLWVGQKSLYPSDVVCCFIWFLESLLNVLISFDRISNVFLPTLQSIIPLVSLFSIFMNIFSSVRSRITVSNTDFSGSSFSRSSNSSSLQTSFSSQQAESVKGFNSSDSLYSWHSTKTRLTSPTKQDSSFSSFNKPFPRKRTSPSSVSLNGDSWSPFSMKTNYHSFRLGGRESNLPSFKSLSQASVNGDFSSGFSSSRPLSRSSSFFSLDKNHMSPNFQRGSRSLNASPCLKEVNKNPPSSLTDNILGIKMNQISLGSSISHSQKSMSDANLSYKSMCSSSSPVLSRGEIAPARLSTFKQENDHHSQNRLFSDRDSLFGSSNYPNVFSDTASVHSDNFSVRSCSSRKSRQFHGENSFSPNNLHLKNDLNQSELNDSDDSKGSSSSCLPNRTSGIPSKNTGSKRNVTLLLVMSVCINILFIILLHRERIHLPTNISTHLSTIVVSFKQFLSSLSISSFFQV